MKKATRFKVILAVTGSIIIISLLVPILIHIAPTLYSMIKSGDYTQIEEYLRSFGVLGVLLAVILQILQVFSVIIPSPVVWLSVGAVYGMGWGLVICTVGIVSGNGIVFMLARKLKIRYEAAAFQKKMGFLTNMKHQNIMTALMFLIPGFPNGIVPYISANTCISARKFLTIVTFSSIPSIIYTTGVGDLLMQGKLKTAIIIIGIAVVLAAAALIFKDKISMFIKRFDGTVLVVE